MSSILPALSRSPSAGQADFDEVPSIPRADSVDSFLNDLDDWDVDGNAREDDGDSFLNSTPPLTSEASSASSQALSTPTSSLLPLEPTLGADTEVDSEGSVNANPTDAQEQSPPPPMSFARLVSEADETRALMEQFRKMREAQAQPPLPATATPLPPAPPAPPPPSPTPPPDITGEEKGATPVNRPTELEVAEQHEFLFPWEAAQEVWARSLSEPPSRSWSLRSNESVDALEERKSRALQFLEAKMIDFMTQLQQSMRMLEPGRESLKVASDLQAVEDLDHEHSFGISLAVQNRKTGKLQVLKHPYDLRPDKTAAVLLQIARIIFISSVLYETILTKGLVTKRDVYYRKVDLFGKQSTVNKIIDDLVATAGLKRQDFCVCATSKGLISSTAMAVHLVAGDTLTMSSSTCALIPSEERIERIEAPDGLDWILVVEKDAVMQSLCGCRLLDDPRLGPGAIITGKGYPDLATLQLLRRLADQFPAADMYALVDADPHGIDILSVYTYGSSKNAFSEDYAGLPLGGRLQWIGVKATELSSLGRYSDLLPLGERDHQLSIKMCTSRPDMPPEWRRELAHMVHLRCKAEIQILCGSDPGDTATTLSQALEGRHTQTQPAESSSTVSSSRLVEYVVARLLGGRER